MDRAWPHARLPPSISRPARPPLPAPSSPRHRRKAIAALRRCGGHCRHTRHSAERRRARVAAALRGVGPGDSARHRPPAAEVACKMGDPMRKQERDALNMTLIALACALLMVLPLVTTFDDLLTAWALQLGVNNPLQAIVPVESRMVVGLLSAVGIKAAASGSHMVVWDGSGSMHVLLISWNCIGWQSLVLLGVSFVSGLRGHQPLDARVQVVIIGVAGTMLLNLLRVAAVAALAATRGQTAAVLFHDYGGALLVVGWP